MNKKFVITYKEDGAPTASFADTYSEAKKLQADIECGLGSRAEIWVKKDNGSYEFLED